MAGITRIPDKGATFRLRYRGALQLPRIAPARGAPGVARTRMRSGRKPVHTQGYGRLSMKYVLVRAFWSKDLPWRKPSTRLTFHFDGGEVRLSYLEPELFKVTAFVVMFELGVRFDDVRLAATTAYQIAQTVTAQPCGARDMNGC